MNYIKRVLNKLCYILYICCIYLKIRCKTLVYHKRLFLMSVPQHGNLGDQAIVIGEEYIFHTLYPKHEIILIPSVFFLSRISKVFSLGIKSNDIIFIHGGGNLGSLYLDEEKIHRDIIKKYKDNKIIFMPSSIFFHTDIIGSRELKKSQNIYNQAGDLIILTRDSISYNFAKKHFINARIMLTPDTVTVLEEASFLMKEDEISIRSGVLFVMRSDKEKVLSDILLNRLKKWLKEKNIKIIMSDTIVDRNIYNKNREIEVRKILDLFKQSKLVITDRFHGVIFSVLTHTPVVVFKSYDSKISSGIKWFKKLPWVYYAEEDNIDTLKKVIIKYFSMTTDDVMTVSDCKEKVLEAFKKLGLHEK